MLSGVIVMSFVSVYGYFFVPHCPIFAPREACLGVDEALLAELEPYADDWATRPVEETEQQRKEFAKQSESVWFIQVVVWSDAYSFSAAGREAVVVDVGTDGWIDWYHGYIYVPDGIDLGNSWKTGTLTRINEHWYFYNYND